MVIIDHRWKAVINKDHRSSTETSSNRKQYENQIKMRNDYSNSIHDGSSTRSDQGSLTDNNSAGWKFPPKGEGETDDCDAGKNNKSAGTNLAELICSQSAELLPILYGSF